MLCALVYMILPILIIVMLYTAIIIEAVNYNIKLEEKTTTPQKIMSYFSILWKVRGITDLSFIVALTTIFWLPLSYGMVVVAADQNYE